MIIINRSLRFSPHPRAVTVVRDFAAFGNDCNSSIAENRQLRCRLHGLFIHERELEQRLQIFRAAECRRLHIEADNHKNMRGLQ